MTELYEKLAYSFGGIFFLLLIASLLILVLKKYAPRVTGLNCSNASPVGGLLLRCFSWL